MGIAEQIMRKILWIDVGEHRDKGPEALKVKPPPPKPEHWPHKNRQAEKLGRAGKKSDIVEEASRALDRAVVKANEPVIKTTDSIHIFPTDGIEAQWARFDDYDLEAHCKEMTCSYLRAVRPSSGNVMYLCAYPKFERTRRQSWIRRCPDLKRRLG